MLKGRQGLAAHFHPDQLRAERPGGQELLQRQVVPQGDQGLGVLGV